MFIDLMIVIVINMISGAMGFLKTIFTSKKLKNPMYVITFIDAILFASILKVAGNSEGFMFVGAYAVGKVLGAYLGNKLDDGLALGIIELKFFISNKEKAILVADALRENGYSVNTAIKFGYSGIKRYEISVALPKKDKNKLHEILFDHGIENPTFIEQDINKVGGKIMVKD